MGLWRVRRPRGTFSLQLLLSDADDGIIDFVLLVVRSQDAFYENYFESQRDHIFRSVELLIYVFDIESREIDVSRGRSKVQ